MKKVVIIDDEEDIVDLLTYHLDKNNYSVLSVSDVQSAIRMVKLEQPDAVIVNYMPQFGNKVRLCKDLHKVIDPSQTRIVCLESQSSASSELAAHVDVCIKIPIKPELLMKRLATLLHDKDNAYR